MELPIFRSSFPFFYFLNPNCKKNPPGLFLIVGLPYCDMRQSEMR